MLRVMCRNLEKNGAVLADNTVTSSLMTYSLHLQPTTQIVFHSRPYSQQFVLSLTVACVFRYYLEINHDCKYTLVIEKNSPFHLNMRE